MRAGTETMVRRRSHGPPVSASSSGGRRTAASPSSARGVWSNEKMKYDFGLTAPSRLSDRADPSKAMRHTWEYKPTNQQVYDQNRNEFWWYNAWGAGIVCFWLTLAFLMMLATRATKSMKLVVRTSRRVRFSPRQIGSAAAFLANRPPRDAYVAPVQYQPVVGYIHQVGRQMAHQLLLCL